VFLLLVYLPVAYASLTKTNDFPHPLSTSAKDPMPQEATNAFGRLVSSGFEVHQTISSMAQCWMIKAMVTGEKSRSLQGMK
jgi:hypothetical protein